MHTNKKIEGFKETISSLKKHNVRRQKDTLIFLEQHIDASMHPYMKNFLKLFNACGKNYNLHISQTKKEWYKHAKKNFRLNECHTNSALIAVSNPNYYFVYGFADFFETYYSASIYNGTYSHSFLIGKNESGIHGIYDVTLSLENILSKNREQLLIAKNYCGIYIPQPILMRMICNKAQTRIVTSLPHVLTRLILSDNWATRMFIKELQKYPRVF